MLGRFLNGKLNASACCIDQVAVSRGALEAERYAESVLAALKTGGAFDRLKKKLVAAVIERRDEPGGLDDTTKAAVTDAIREAGDHDLPLDMGAAALAAKISADIEESVLTRVAVEAWDALAGEVRARARARAACSTCALAAAALALWPLPVPPSSTPSVP